MSFISAFRWVFAFVLLSTSSAFADRQVVSGWKRANLRSAEGISISIDYQVVFANYSSNKPYTYWWLNPIIFNVSGPGLGARDQVRVVLLNNAKNLGECGQRAYDWQEAAYVNLVRAPEGHFYGNLTEDGLRRQTFSNQYTDRVGDITLVQAPYCGTQVSVGQEIAVVINNRWLVDPITRTNNFRLDLESEISSRYRR